MNPKYDLEERTEKFAIDIVKFSKDIAQNTVNAPLINQLVRSGTSIGANYMEANSACSKKDFKNKIYICKKEAQETMYWLKVVSECELSKQQEVRALWKEAHELTLIFGKIISSLRPE